MPRTRFSLRGLFLATALFAAALALLMPAVDRAREEGDRCNCCCHLGQLEMALMNYHGEYGCFPPAYVPDASGRPMHSWRVLLLPFLVEYGVYKQYDFNEPWNGPNNRRIADKIPTEMFQCPSRRHPKDSPITDYVVVVGKDTIFPGPVSRSYGDISDGLENTILLVEIGNSDIHWMEPRDLRFEQMSFAINDPSCPSISSAHPAGPHVAIIGWHSYPMKGGALRRETVRALLTASGGEPVCTKDLQRLDPGTGYWCWAEEAPSND